MINLHNFIVVNTKEAFKEAINGYPLLLGCYARFYIGITADIERRLQEHSIQSDDWVVCWKADSAEEARSVERMFLSKGMQGDTGGGIDPSWAYCYLTNYHTKE